MSLAAISNYSTFQYLLNIILNCYYHNSFTLRLKFNTRPERYTFFLLDKVSSIDLKYFTKRNCWHFSEHSSQIRFKKLRMKDDILSKWHTWSSVLLGLHKYLFYLLKHLYSKIFIKKINCKNLSYSKSI